MTELEAQEWLIANWGHLYHRLWRGRYIVHRIFGLVRYNPWEGDVVILRRADYNSQSSPPGTMTRLYLACFLNQYVPIDETVESTV